jgi:PAS domain-containing protein
VVPHSTSDSGVRRSQKADAALRASEIRYRRLFEAAHDGILILNAASGEITAVNPFLCKLLGYEKAEFLGPAPGDRR